MAKPIWLEVFLDPDAEQGLALAPVVAKLLAKDPCLKPHLFLVPGLGRRAASEEAGRTWGTADHRVAHGPGVTLAPASPASPMTLALKAAGTLSPNAQFKLLAALGPASDREGTLAAARRAGLNVEALQQALASPVLDAELAQDRVAAQESGVCHAPALVLRNDAGGRVVVEGVRNYALVAAAVDVLRAEPLPVDAPVSEALTATPIMPEISQIMPDQAPTG